MRRTFSTALVLAALLLVAGAALAMQHGMAHGGARNCMYCGMDLAKFAHSRMTIAYDDGSAIETCSLHCAAVDLAINIDKTPASISVGDMDTREAIDAETASWVIGGSKMGVMTANAKWAFLTGDAADSFVGKFGGRRATFDEAVEQAYLDMYRDTKTIREKRKMMRQGMAPQH
jgi:nitrous oxide reductase accessory protein NosL